MSGIDTGIRWVCNTKYVDIDTGEQILKRTKEETRLEVANKYIILKTIKHTEVNHAKTRGTIEYTIQCRRNPQTELQFGGT